MTELLEFYSTNSLSWENLEYQDHILLNLHYGLIHNSLTAQIDLSEYKLPNIKAQFLPAKYQLCKEGDVVFADASEDINDVGKVIEFINCRGRDVTSGLHTIHGRDKLGMTVVGFKSYAFSSRPFRNQIRQLAQGTKVYSLSTKNFNDCLVSIPIKEEQQKIVEILFRISKKINIERKVLFKFQTQKTSLLRKLFI